jgi:hypothetical protein
MPFEDSVSKYIANKMYRDEGTCKGLSVLPYHLHTILVRADGPFKGLCYEIDMVFVVIHGLDSLEA